MRMLDDGGGSMTPNDESRIAKLEWRVVAVDGEPHPEDLLPCITYGAWLKDRTAAERGAAAMRSETDLLYTEVWVEQRETFIRITKPHRIDPRSPIGI
jgi:hypothetical protein